MELSRLLKQRVLLSLLALPLAAGEYDGAGKKGAGPYEQEITRGEWVDSERDHREVPWKLYYPKGAPTPAPVVIWSHGSGGSREGAEYLGRHLASHGYAAFHIQHHGSDRDQARSGMTREAATLVRFGDAGFAVQQIEAMNGDGRFDTAAMGISGHSFGAATTLRGNAKITTQP